MVVLQKAAESVPTFDVPTSLPDFLARFEDLVAEPLMVSLAMEMVQVSVDGSSQRPFAEEDHLFDAFGLEAQVEPFQVRVQIGASRR